MNTRQDHDGCPYEGALEDDGSWWCEKCGQHGAPPKAPFDPRPFAGMARQRRTPA